MRASPIRYLVPPLVAARRVQAGRRTPSIPLLLLAAFLLPAAPALARDRTQDVERFRPGAGPGRLIGEEQPEVLEHLGFSGSLLLGYSSKPLVFDSASRGIVPVVSSKLGMDLAVALGLWGRAEVGAVLPLALSMSGEAPPAAEAAGLPAGEGTGLGDVRLAVKVALLQGGPFALSLVGQGSLPSGDEARYLGDGAWGGSVAATSQLDLGRTSLVADAGYRLRHVDALPGTYAGDELIFAGGGLVQVLPEKLDLRAEIAGATGVGSAAFGGESETMLETRFAAGIQPAPSLGLLLGAGIPVLHGVGTPSWRVFAGVSWAPRDFDRDRDGVLDAQDDCKGQAEDHDGFEDEDGCPDLDNDKDGVPDAQDRCPLDPEDVDRFEDADGCPDEDNDGDGVSDLDDGCPDQAEDVDGFQDDDGCPDEDNDGDGIPDPQDLCPFEAEDRDGNKDDDGCPDDDDDGDGIPDAADRCPKEHETWNARDDGDGCPDEGKGRSLLSIEVAQGRIRQIVPIVFAKGDSDPTSASYALLDQLASLLRLHQGLLKIRLVGFAEPGEGDAGFRHVLGEARAQAVLAFLLDAGVDATKLEAASGEPAPPQAAAPAPAAVPGAPAATGPPPAPSAPTAAAGPQPNPEPPATSAPKPGPTPAATAPAPAPEHPAAAPAPAATAPTKASAPAFVRPRGEKVAIQILEAVGK